MSTLRIAGLLLVAGAAVTFGLHLLEAPEELFRWLYDRLLSGLDVPEEPPQGAVDAIHYLSLFGGIAELIAGAALLIVDWRRASAGSAT